MKRENLIRNLLIATFALGLILQQAISVQAAFGDLDTTYSSDGIFTDTFKFTPRGIARQSDGKMLIVGYVQDAGDTYTLILRRYNASGGRDTTFGWNSNAVPYNTFGLGNALYVQSDGKIVVAGDFSPSPGVWKGAVWRFNSNGSYDSGFGISGRVLLGSQMGFSDVAGYRALKTDPLDLYLVSSNKKVYCLQPNGSLKTSFGSAGSFTGTVEPTYPDPLSVRSTGIYVSGRTNEGTAAISRHNLSGQVDTGFGTNGVFDQDAFTSLGCQYSQANLGQTQEHHGPIAIQSSGKIVTKIWHKVILPQFLIEGSSSILARLNPNGGFDTGFSDTCSQGLVGWTVPPWETKLLNVFSDNRIVEALKDNSENYTIARYTEAGIPDGSFTAISNVERLLPLSDGKIVVVGIVYTAEFGMQVRITRHLS